MWFRTWARFFRRPPANGRLPETPPAAVALPQGSDLGAPLPAIAATALASVGAALKRLSPQAVDDFTARAPALVGQLGTGAFVEICRLLTLAGETHHTARLADIIRETCQVAASLARDERSVALLVAVGSLYAEQPLLGVAALRAAVHHPELTAEAFVKWLAVSRSHSGGEVSKLGSFLRLETDQAQHLLEACLPGLPLVEVAPTLQYYLRALTGQNFRLLPLTSEAVGTEIGGRVAPTTDVHCLSLPRRVAVFPERSRNFLLYKLLAAQAAGRLLFGTDTPDMPPVVAAYEVTRAFFAGLGAGAGGLSHVDFAVVRPRAVEPVLPPRPAVITARDTLALFPDRDTAEALFDVIEMARVLWRMRRAYRGVARDTAALTAPLLVSRRSLTGAPLTTAAVELLFRLALVGQVGADIEAEYAALTGTLAAALAPCLTQEATVADSLRATLEVYRLLPPPTQKCRSPEARSPNQDAASPSATDSTGRLAAEAPVLAPPDGETRGSTAGLGAEPVPLPEMMTPTGAPPANTTLASDRAWIGDLAPAWTVVETYRYPEWDVRLGDYRPNWCRVLDLGIAGGRRPSDVPANSTVAQVRRVCDRWPRTDMAWLRPTTDGQELFLEAVIDRYVERRSGWRAADAVYAVRRRLTRSVAVLLLLDISRSTGKPIHDLGAAGGMRRVLDSAIESIHCLSLALEQLGDRFAVYAFNSRGRHAVACFRLKTFGESAAYLAPRLTTLAPAANTRLGAAVRHATRLLLTAPARQRLLLIVTDGLPQDGDYGDVTYAVADTRQALGEAQALGVKPLAVAVEAGQESGLLDALFGRGRYARIRTAVQLPEALPRLYRQWTL